SATSFPFTRARKTSPALMCRSLAPRSTAALMIFSIPELPVSDAISRLPWGEEAHPGLHRRQRLARELPRLRRPRREHLIDLPWIRLERGGTGADRGELLRHVVGEDLLAVDAPPLRPTALLRHLGDGLGRGEMLVQGVEVADVGVPRVLLRLPRRI